MSMLKSLFITSEKPFYYFRKAFLLLPKSLFITSEKPFYYSGKFGEEIGRNILFSNETLARA
jgi:hypothetical protein